MPPSIRFTCLLTVDKDGSVGAIPVEFDQRAVFGQARPPVVVTIGGYSYRNTIAVMRGRSFVPLRRSHRVAAGIDHAGPWEVTLTLDTLPREVAAPAVLDEALGAAGLRDAWHGQSYTQRREDAEAIDGAKRDDTRARRVAAVIARLAGARRPD